MLALTAKLQQELQTVKSENLRLKMMQVANQVDSDQALIGLIEEVFDGSSRNDAVSQIELLVRLREKKCDTVV